ncbi:MAG: hypothetical protein ABIZ49_13835 [Opitutaceae bacterium]
MKKFLLAPALAALAMFVFGAVFWMSPLPYKVLRPLADDGAAAEALAKIFPGTGAYFVPGMYLPPEKHEELAKRGPVAEVHFVKEGMPPMDPLQLLKGYLHEFGICLVLVFMLDASGQAFRGFGSRVRFCGTIGLLIALYDYGQSVWWHHAVSWVTMQAVYDFIAFFIAGLVLGKLLTPKRISPTAAAAAGI